MKSNSIDRFTRAVDTALSRTSPTGGAERSENEGGELEIIQALAAADFSPDSRIRHSLKRRLLEPTPTRKAAVNHRSTRAKRLGRPALAAALIALLVLAASPLGATLARSLVQILDNRQVGENTTAVSVEGDFEAVQDEAGNTVILPPTGLEIPGEVPAETGLETDQTRHLTLDPTIPFDQAQEMVKFNLRMPAFVPEGYRFIGVVVIRTEQVSLEFVNLDTNRLIGLLQTAVGEADGKVQVTYTSDMLVVDTLVDGHAALWTQAGDEGLLLWEANGVNYQLVGVADLETALQIAESLP